MSEIHFRELPPGTERAAMLNQEMCYKLFMYHYIEKQQLRERSVIWKAAERGKIRSAFSAWFTALLIEDTITAVPQWQCG